MKIDQFQYIVWGLAGECNNTYRYIQEAFYRALKHQGRRVRWINEDDGGDFEKAIFISMGGISSIIPVRPDGLYIMHNLIGSHAEERLSNSNILHFGVRIDDTPADDKFPDNQTAVYWATNLLPHEIEANKTGAQTLNANSRVINWVGTFSRGAQGNMDEISAFMQEARAHGVDLQRHRDKSLQENVDLIRASRFAPAIVGSWQNRVGYVPCRIFKNISYGHFGVTNSVAVNRAFGNQLIFNPDTKELFNQANNELPSVPVEKLYQLMDYVAANHTFLNRIDHLLHKAEKLV